MRYSRFLTVLAGFFLLAGCASLRPHQGVEQLGAMVPATEQPASDANPLIKNMQEPAPEQQANSSTNDNLWQVLRTGFKLDEQTDNSRIDEQRAWFANHQAYLDRMVARARRYLYYTTHETQERKMPLELALLPVVESAYDPFAYSRGHASGPWQFISSTGKLYDLKQDWWFDGRRDIIDSTQAALSYLQQLADLFNGDWLLALAAYNAGAGTVSRAIARNQSRGLPIDFWHLDLPRETSAYVPKLLAVAQLVENPAKYGITLDNIPDEPYFAVIDTGGQIDLSQAAQMAGISVEELSMLNPGFNRWITPPNGPDRLLVPVQHAPDFQTALAAVPADQRVSWTRYVVKRHDTLGSISEHKSVPVDVLRRVNHLDNDKLASGSTLLIPDSSAATGSKGGDYALALEKTLLNHNQPAARPGEPTDGQRQISYKVRSGDNLSTIARRHHVTVKELMAWNNMHHNSRLRAGQHLKLYAKTGHGHRALARNSHRKSHREVARQDSRRVRYSVRSGDSLYAIANKFNVSVAAIQRWNGISSAHNLRSGQHLTLYVEASNVD